MIFIVILKSKKNKNLQYLFFHMTSFFDLKIKKTIESLRFLLKVISLFKYFQE